MAKYTLDKEKYKAAFLYIASTLGNIEGKKKAYKLFYFLDFDYFEAYGKPFTGEVYKSLPMGPAPVYFDGVIEELLSDGIIRVEKKRKTPAHDHDTITYEPIKNIAYKFTEEEKKMLDRVIKLYGNLTGKNLENISHSEAPYNAVDLYQIIPYDYSIYRDTPDLTK